MAKNCEACCKTIKSTQHVLQCTTCISAYHAVCVNVHDPREITDSFKDKWTCPACKSMQPKTGNSCTPLRAPITSDDSSANANVTLRAQNRKAVSPVVITEVSFEPVTLSSLATEIKLMRQDMCKMSEHFQTLTASYTQCITRIDQYESRFTALAARIRTVEDCEIENGALRHRVTQLEDQFNSQAQGRLSNEMEIAGVNECPHENKIHIVLTAAIKMGVTLSDADLDVVTRAGPRGSAVSSGENSLPRPLVVKFVRRAKRNEFLKAAKSRRNMTTVAIEVDGPPRKLYFNERLTKQNRQLFREARVRSNSAGFKFCWTRNGTILIRKKTGSPEIIIRSIADLDQHLRANTEASGPSEQLLDPFTAMAQEQTTDEKTVSV